MKLSTLLIIISLINVSAEVTSQTESFTISLKDSKVQEVLKEITKQSDYEFLYNNEEIQKCDKVDINVKNGTIDEVLKLCLKNQHLTYQITDKVIIIKPVPPRKTIKSVGLTQVVRGRVTDKEAHIALPGATIMILNTDPLKATISDEEGYFRLEDVPVGRYNINAGYIGYESYIISDIQVTTGKEVVLEIQLKEQAFSLGELVIKPKKDK